MENSTSYSINRYYIHYIQIISSRIYNDDYKLYSVFSSQIPNYLINRDKKFNIRN